MIEWSDLRRRFKLLFKRSTVSPPKSRLWLTLLKLAAFLSVLWFAYWAIIWEMVFWQKSLAQAFFASSWNWILMGGSLFLLLEITFFERRTKKTGHADSNLFFMSIPEVKKAQNINPQFCPRQVLPPTENPIILVSDADLFKPAQPAAAGSLFGLRHESPASRKGKRRFHMRFLRQSKRVFSGFLLILYILLSIVSLSSGSPMFILFLGTTFIVFDYLWKTRRTAKI